jgi:hypothetical protein
MRATHDTLRHVIEGLAREIADRCTSEERLGHAQIERHVRNVLADYFTGKFNPAGGSTANAAGAGGREATTRGNREAAG